MSRSAKRDLGKALDVSLAKADAGRLADRAERAERYLNEEGRQAEPIAPNAPRPPAAKPVRPKRKPVVRDTFSFPEEDYALIGTLRDRLMGAGVAATKSELLRLGLLTLAELSGPELAEAYARVRKLKPGRPAG